MVYGYCGRLARSDQLRVERQKETGEGNVPNLNNPATQSYTKLRCLIAVIASIAISIIIMGVGALALPHGAFGWKILGLIMLAIASAVLAVSVQGIHTFSKPSLQIVVLALLAVVVMQLFLWNLQPDMSAIDEFKSYSPIYQAITIIIMCVVSPIFEEIYFRGLLFPIMSMHLGAVIAAILSAAFFVVLHPASNVIIATAFYTWLVYRSRSVYPGMVAHITFNSMVFLRILTWQP